MEEGAGAGIHCSIMPKPSSMAITVDSTDPIIFLPAFPIRSHRCRAPHTQITRSSAIKWKMRWHVWCSFATVVRSICLIQ